MIRIQIRSAPDHSRRGRASPPSSTASPVFRRRPSPPRLPFQDCPFPRLPNAASVRASPRQIRAQQRVTWESDHGPQSSRFSRRHRRRHTRRLGLVDGTSLVSIRSARYTHARTNIRGAFAENERDDLPSAVRCAQDRHRQPARDRSAGRGTHPAGAFTSISGGAGDEWTKQENQDAFKQPCEFIRVT